MTIRKMKSIIESILFSSGEPVKIKKLCEILSSEKKIVTTLLRELAEKFELDDSGIRLVKLEDSFQLCSKKENGEYVKSFLDTRRNMPLSQAAMEVLAVIAYNQPVTKSFIEQVRGVDCSCIVNNLIEKELVEEKGRLELPGRPIVYGTTLTFLRCFGIENICDLPKLQTVSEEEEK